MADNEVARRLAEYMSGAKSPARTTPALVQEAEENLSTGNKQPEVQEANKPRSNSYDGAGALAALKDATACIDPTLTPSISRQIAITRNQARKTSPEFKSLLLAQAQHEGNTISTELSSVLKYMSENIWYRQSMMADYMVCPLMMMFRWVMGLPQQKAWGAAFLGTAGHKVVEEIHKLRNFEMERSEIQKIFMDEYELSVQSFLRESNQPESNAAGYRTSLAANLEEYTDILEGYQLDSRNRQFSPTVMEQDFVVIIYDEEGTPYVYTGTIDQAGYKNNGSFALRDMKFRVDAYRPTHWEVFLSMQMSLYSYALVYGNPCCKLCRPKTLIDDSTGKPVISYEGPCDKCKRQIGGPFWPRLLPSETSIIWMKDYIPYKRDQYTQFIDDPLGGKVTNPKTGRLIKKMIENPKWKDGYKKGERAGDVMITTARPMEFLRTHIADIMKVSEQISSGNFYRRSGSHCNQFCQYQSQCKDSMELKVEEVGELNIYDNAIRLSEEEGI